MRKTDFFLQQSTARAMAQTGLPPHSGERMKIESTTSSKLRAPSLKVIQNIENRISIRRATAIGKSSHNDFEALTQILKNKSMRDQFREYLTKTFSAENLDFWSDAKLIQK